MLAEDGDADIFAINKIAGIEEATAEELAQELPVIIREELSAASTYLQEQVLLILDTHAKKEAHQG